MKSDLSKTISVVTPSYNQSQFLAETIESVISQEGDFYLDYIIVDGGSNDNSVDIIKKYDELLKRNTWKINCKGINYRWVSEKDEGQTDAIIKGFSQANGEILAWINSDDIYLTGALNQVMNCFFDNKNISVVYGKTYFTDLSGKIIGKYPTIPFDKKIFPVFNFVCQPSVFFKKMAVETVGGLDKSLNFVMDYDFWIRLSQKYEFFYIDHFLSTYRLHENSKTISVHSALENHSEALNIVLKHYGMAPLNRVYSFCFHKIKNKFPRMNNKFVIFFSLWMATIKYLILNRGVRVDDYKLLKWENMRKLSMNMMDIYKDY